jgi:hypothetical protein
MMSSRPSFAQLASTSCGTSVRCPAASDADADDVTSFSTAWRATLLGGLEQRADVDVEAEVGERRRDDLLAAVVAVLAHLGDEMRGRRPSLLSKASTAATAPPSRSWPSSPL